MKARVIGWTLGSIPFSAFWLVAVNLPQDNPGPFVQAAAILPQMVAVTSLLIQSAADAYNQPEPEPEAVAPVLPLPAQTRPRPRELVR